ncbi:MAG: methylated-DNA--[protein]-cysteine S-methyltransferase [Candidatus Kariarchaeaceae archaeon]|jgi:O-6-methylguanine DNA methyltransferase
MTILVQVIQTPLGAMHAGVDSSTSTLVFFDFDNRKSFDDLLEKRVKKWGATVQGRHPLHEEIEQQISEYFNGTRKKFDIPLTLSGTEFEVEVWNTLLEIGYGKTKSYGDMAQMMGRSAYLSRAVGRANSQNCIAIIVPCHRVIGSNGKLVGYGGGIDRKEKLLALENKGVQTSLDAFV